MLTSLRNNSRQRLGWAVDQESLEVQEVGDGYQAQQLGVEVGNRIVAVGDVEVATIDGLIQQIAAVKAGSGSAVVRFAIKQQRGFGRKR